LTVTSATLKPAPVQPDRRGRGQAVDRVAAHDDQARAEEADARHDLRGDPRRVEDDQAP